MDNVELSESWRHDSWVAQAVLAQWMHRVGTSGMTAMKSSPGLLAEVDQHIAEVRDALADPAGHFAVASLASYADGVADMALRRGWSIGEVGTSRWSDAPWLLVRLLAVCVIADTEGLFTDPSRPGSL